MPVFTCLFMGKDECACPSNKLCQRFNASESNFYLCRTIRQGFFVAPWGHISNYLQQNEIIAKVYKQKQQVLPNSEPCTLAVKNPHQKRKLTSRKNITSPVYINKPLPLILTTTTGVRTQTVIFPI